MKDETLIDQIDIYAATLRQYEAVSESLKPIEARYEAALEKVMQAFREENPDLVAEYKAGREKLVAASTYVDQAKSAVRSRLAVYWQNAPQDKTPAPGISYRREKRPVYDRVTLLHAAHQFAPFLLCVDETAVQQFVNKHAVERKDGTFQMAENVRDWLPLDVATTYVPLINERDLQEFVMEPVDTDAEGSGEAIPE